MLPARVGRAATFRGDPSASQLLRYVTSTVIGAIINDHYFKQMRDNQELVYNPYQRDLFVVGGNHDR